MGGKQPVYLAGVTYDNSRQKDSREAMIAKALSGIPDYAFCYPVGSPSRIL